MFFRRKKWLHDEFDEKLLELTEPIEIRLEQSEITGGKKL